MLYVQQLKDSVKPLPSVVNWWQIDSEDRKVPSHFGEKRCISFTIMLENLETLKPSHQPLRRFEAKLYF